MIRITKGGQKERKVLTLVEASTETITSGVPGAHKPSRHFVMEKGPKDRESNPNASKPKGPDLLLN